MIHRQLPRAPVLTRIHTPKITSCAAVLHTRKQGTAANSCAISSKTVHPETYTNMNSDPSISQREQTVAKHANTRRSCILIPAVSAATLVLSSPSSASAKDSAPKKSAASSGDWSSPGLSVPVDESAPKFSKTASGVRIQELAMGSGPAAAVGDAVLFDYVLRRANGEHLLCWLIPTD